MDTAIVIAVTFFGAWAYNTAGYALMGWASSKRNQVDDEILNPMMPTFMLFWPVMVPLMIRDWLRTRKEPWYIDNENDRKRRRE